MGTKTILSLSDLRVRLNDDSTKVLSEKQFSLVLDTVNEYELMPEIEVFETVHGHIAQMTRREGRYTLGSEGKPARLDKNDLVFFTAMGDNLRHFELSTNRVLIGL